MTATACDSGAALVKSRLAGAAGESDDAALQGRDHGGGAVVDTELGEHVQQVGLDRGLADEQGGGDVGVARAPRDQLEDLDLAAVRASVPGWRMRLTSRVATVGARTVSPRAAARMAG